MMKIAFSFIKKCRIFSYSCYSSQASKEFFVELAKHTIDVQNSKGSRDYLKFLKDDNEKAALLKSLNHETIDRTLEHDQLTMNQTHNSLKYSHEADIQNFEELPKDPNEEYDNLTIDTLQKKIENIDLDEIKNVPTNLLNLSPIIDKNKTLRNFLQIGVDLHEIQNKKQGSNILVRLDWDTGVEPVISFLRKQGNFADKQLAAIFSHYPRIFRKSLLECRYIFDYLKSREISSDDLVAIVSAQPFIFHHDKDYLRKKLEEIQLLVNLKTTEMNEIIIAEPRVLTENIIKLKMCITQLTKSMGFTDKEMKQIITDSPRILLKNKEDLIKNFIFLHRTLNMSYEDISNNAAAFSFTPSALSERVKYLIFMNRYQTDPTKELYTPIMNIAKGSDLEFCENVAHTSMNQFRKFLKTM